MNDDGFLTGIIRERWNDTCRSEIERLSDNIEKLDTLSSQAIPELSTQLEEKLRETLARLEESVDRLSEAMDSYIPAALELAETCQDILPAALEASHELTQDACERTTKLLEEEFQEQAVAAATKQAEALSQSLETRRAEILDKLKSLEGDSQQRVSELISRLESFRDKWVEEVNDVKSEYVRVVEQISAIGENVEKLSETMDDAMRTTGVGMNAAVSVIDEMKGILEDVT